VIEKEGLYTKKELEETKQPSKPMCSSSEITQEEQELMNQRLKQQQELFKKLEKRDRKNRIFQIRNLIRHITNEEALYALKICNNSEEDAIVKLTDFSFLQQIRKAIALDYNPNPSLQVDHLIPIAERWHNEHDEESPSEPIPPPIIMAPPISILSNLNNNNDDEPTEEIAEEEDDKNDDDFVISKSSSDKKKRSKSQKPSKNSTQKRKKVQVESASSESEEEEKTKRKKRKSAASSSSSSTTPVTRLLLDDALSDVQKKEGWSKARIEAYEKIKTNPNAYYYRFNEPGEKQKNGKWSQKEKLKFIEKLKEYVQETDNFQWGLFSKHIPGRVGYQCSCFYRTLLKSREIKEDLVEACKNRDQAASSSKKRKRRVTRHKKPTVDEEEDSANDEDDDDEESSTPTPDDSTENSSHGGQEESSEDDDDYEEEEEHRRHNHPLPEDFIDPITMQAIEEPAISPYGHVLGYQTWLKVLNTEPKNTCPFTKQPLTKRNLTKLNFDNFEEYKDKIRNKDDQD